MKSFDKEDILFLDNHLIVANKPGGYLTQPDGSDHCDLETQLKEWVKRAFQKPFGVFLHAVHRLDRPVSGLVLFARTSKALTRLNEQMRRHEIARHYVAEVEGQVPESGTLEHYLLRASHRTTLCLPTHPEAKKARLQFVRLSCSDHTSFVRIQLETGRYHQIRAQFAAIGHPVCKDRRYGAKEGGDAIHLHCESLSFLQPISLSKVSIVKSAPFYFVN